MTASPLILLYGSDRRLIETRELVLRRAGFDVHAAMQLSEFEQAGNRSTPEVIVLCHTLMQKECDEALKVVRSRWPKAQQLVLTAGSRGCTDRNVSDVMDAADGPEQLINHVAHLVSGQNVSHNLQRIA